MYTAIAGAIHKVHSIFQWIQYILRVGHPCMKNAIIWLFVTPLSLSMKFTNTADWLACHVEVKMTVTNDPIHALTVCVSRRVEAIPRGRSPAYPCGTRGSRQTFNTFRRFVHTITRPASMRGNITSDHFPHTCLEEIAKMFNCAFRRISQFCTFWVYYVCSI